MNLHNGTRRVFFQARWLAVKAIAYCLGIGYLVPQSETAYRTYLYHNGWCFCSMCKPPSQSWEEIVDTAGDMNKVT